jgi:hypothetical protein
MAEASPNRVLLATVLASAVLFSGCGDEDDEAATSEEQAAKAVVIEPTDVEESIEGFLADDKAASSLEATVDCGEEPAETVDCTISGDKGLTGEATAAPSQGFSYTGEIEDRYGPNSFGGSGSEGSIDDPAAVEESLNQTLADSDTAGTPTADCPEAPENNELVCEISGDDVTGTLTATPIGGFEWEGQIETPDGTRAISGNALPE